MHQLVMRRLARFYWTSLAISGTPSSRVAAALVSRLALVGNDHGEERTIPIRQKDLTRLTAMSRSGVADGLAALVKADVIRLGGDRPSRFSGVVLIPDVDPLKDHAFAEVARQGKSGPCSLGRTMNEQSLTGQAINIMGSSPYHFSRIDDRLGSPNSRYVNRVADALMKATGDSSRVAESSCDERPSGAPVAILHVPADSAGPLNVARYLAVIRLTAPCSPVGAAAAWIPPNRLWNCARLDVALVAVLSDAGL